MTKLMPVSEARMRLAELLNDADDEEVVLLKHGRPVGVLVSYEGYERLLDRIEDLEDELSLLKADPNSETVSVSELAAELDVDLTRDPSTKAS